jgi:myosin V
VLNVIGGKGGILRMLDEEIKFGTRGSSESFFQKMDKAHGKPAPKGKGKKITALITTKAHCSWFKVKHFAGVVQYESTGFLEKNKDSLNGEIVSIFTNSKDSLLQVLFTPKVVAEDTSETKTGSKKKKKTGAKTVSSQFRASLNELMKSIKATETHYIRCIKSNQQKIPGTFDSPYILSQLRSGGVFSAADIRSKGFPFRKSHKDFYEHFRPLSFCFTNLPSFTEGNEKEYCSSVISELIKSSSITDKQIIVGSSMVLYQSPSHLELEKLRSAAIEDAFKKVDTGDSGFVPLSEIPKILSTLNIKYEDALSLLEDDPVSFDSYRRLIDSKQV